MATIRVGINGFGRIGRAVFRRVLETKQFKIVAVNDLTDAHTLAHLLKYDSNMGVLNKDVRYEGDSFIVGNQKVKVLSERDPAALPWKKLNVDVVIESTGIFTSPAKLNLHLKAGAKKVILSAPSKKSSPEELEKFGYDKDDVDATICMGVNESTYNPKKHHIISNASCTTNCLAPVAKVLNDEFGIVQGLMTTVHSYTNDQNILDAPHKDLRRARAAAVSMIPTTTGAAKAIGLVLPELKGKLDGMAIRVPTPDVSLVDLTANLKKPVSIEKVNAAMKKAAEGKLKGILRYLDEPLVSVDLMGDTHSSAFDSLCTKVIDDKFVKILSWYDNEYGYSCRVVDLAAKVGASL
ncbi:MAG: type I glyceraldehyde-3-phosphate dehydrogenase [Deltaproteobacteria bacterium]|nr:type I glyceraldehyde-3-phosphate dehydrogenase [Deltaproteobacteria bacterium]MCB9478884.1 type I glyceraldehyde-3-phosphate dehydrogenase [Deltaproteobacteria bacterium]MCB9489390.1 type I glyceraldehyde-3-phosphate dehydrogenase [Deltaproteobacteria bacterium]